jgi:hypothetical protein
VGAPRIHGELLNLGIGVSERTVSRYLPDRRTAPSQTWRTLVANHLGDLPCTSIMMSSYAPNDEDGVDACGLPVRLTWPFATGRAPPIRARLSIGRRHSKTRLVAGVSPRIIFTAVHAHAPAPVGIRRRRGQLHWSNGVRGGVLSSGDSGWPLRPNVAMRSPDANRHQRL